MIANSFSPSVQNPRISQNLYTNNELADREIQRHSLLSIRQDISKLYQLRQLHKEGNMAKDF